MNINMGNDKRLDSKLEEKFRKLVTEKYPSAKDFEYYISDDGKTLNITTKFIKTSPEITLEWIKGYWRTIKCNLYWHNYYKWNLHL